MTKLEDNRNSASLEDYVNSRLLTDKENPDIFLKMITPIALRINIYIVNVNTGFEAQVRILILLNLFRQV